MARSVIRWLLAGILLIHLAGVSSSAQEVNFGQWAHLAPYIGARDFEAVLRDPMVAEAIDHLLGPLAAQLPNNMRLRTPIDFVSGALVLAGRATHAEAEFEAASVWVHLDSGYVPVILKHEGKATVFSEHRYDTHTWPREFRDAVWAAATYPMDRTLPDGLMWIHGGEPRDPPGEPIFPEVPLR